MIILKWPYNSPFLLSVTLSPVIPLSQVQRAAPSHSLSLLPFNQCRLTPTVFHGSDDKWLAIILFRLLPMEIYLSWLMSYMTWGTLRRRRRRRDLPAYLLISTLGYPPSADWYHVRCCRGGRFTLIVGKLFWEESYSLLWCITMSRLSAPPYQSVQEAKSLRFVSSAFWPSKIPFSTGLMSHFLGRESRK